MNKINVCCEVEVYPKGEFSGSLAAEKLIIKSAKDYKECIILELNKKEYRVYASELKLAVDNALNAH